MSRLLLLAVGSCLFVSPLRAETTRIELKYVAVADILEQLVRGMSGLKTDEEIEALVKRGKARIRGATVVIDPRENNMRLEGDADTLKRVWDFVEKVDVRPTQVKLKGLFVDVELDDAFPSAIDLFGGKGRGGPLILEGEDAALERLEQKAIDSMRATVASRPQVFAATNKDANFAFNVGEDATFTATTRPHVHADGEVTLSVELIGQFGDRNHQLKTLVRIGDGSVVVLGGILRKDDDGNRKEMLFLLQPEVVKGDEEGEEANPLE